MIEDMQKLACQLTRFNVRVGGIDKRIERAAEDHERRWSRLPTLLQLGNAPLKGPKRHAWSALVGLPQVRCAKVVKVAAQNALAVLLLMLAALAQAFSVGLVGLQVRHGGSPSVE